MHGLLRQRRPALALPLRRQRHGLHRSADDRFRFADLPPTWLGLQEDADAESDGIRCERFDVFATAAKVCSKHRASSAESVSSGLCLIGLLERRAQGAPLGSFTDGWSAVIPPHGVRFLKLGNCTNAQ